MVIYMLSLPNIIDHLMDDGTTGFVMALARQDSDMVRAILASLPPTPVNQGAIHK